MKILAALGAKDEADLVAVSAAHMRRIGADMVLVLDLGSEDGTRDVVERLGAHDSRIRWVDAREGLWTAAARSATALEGFEPDWLLLADADELWLPRDGSLKRLAGIADCDVLVASRFNVPLTSPPIDVVDLVQTGRAAELPLIVKRDALDTETMRADATRRWIMNAINDKVMCRTNVAEGLAPGAHRVHPPDGTRLRTRKADDVLIVHVPLTSYDRFERKVGNARHELERARGVLTGDRAWHWRRWVELDDRGLLPAEFEAQRMDGAELDAARRAAIVRTAAEMLQGDDDASAPTS